MPLDYHEQVVEVVGDTAGQAPDGFHFLRLAQLQLEVAALANVLGNNKAHAFAGINQGVGDDFDLECLAVFGLVQPKTMVFVVFVYLMKMGHGLFALGGRANIEYGHVLELFVGISVKMDGGIVDAEELKRVGLMQPRRHGVALKEEAQDGFALAKFLLGAAALDGQGDVATNGIEEFEVADIIGVFVLVVLNDEDADGGGGRL